MNFRGGAFFSCRDVVRLNVATEVGKEGRSALSVRVSVRRNGALIVEGEQAFSGKRASERLSKPRSDVDRARAESALARAEMRVRFARMSSSLLDRQILTDGLVLLTEFRVGAIHIGCPFEDASFRWEKDTSKVYRGFYGKPVSENGCRRSWYVP